MKKVGRYVIISELGRGAMGIVYKAMDPTIDREVALKVLSLNSTQEEGTNSPQEMFMREVRAAGRLAHPSIVTIFDAFDDPVNQTSCIVMELVPGVTLEKVLDSGKPPTTEQSLDLIRQVGEALDYAHRNKVIHRDLKPANILVTDDGRAKITDFGIAKVLAREGMARTIGIMGTPSYMSPEQVRGGEIDARTDIFSLGIMIFTMLTGQKPFSGNTAAVMFKIVYEEPPLPSSVNPQLTPGHDYLVKKCLAKDRADRFSSVRELLTDLDDIRHGSSPRSQGQIPVPAPSVPVASPMDHPAAAPHSSADQTVAKPQPPRMPPPATPLRAEAQPPRPSVPAPEVTKSMPRPPQISAPPSPSRATAPPLQPVAPPPAKPGQPLMGKTLVMRVPDLAHVSSPSSPQEAKVPPAPPDSPLMGRTLPMRVPDLSAVSQQGSSTPQAPPLPTPPSPPLRGRTLPMQVPDLATVTPHEIAPHPGTTAAIPPYEFGSSEPTIHAETPDLTVAAPAAEPPSYAPPRVPASEAATSTMHLEEAPAEVTPGHKSKLLPVIVGVAAFLCLALAGLGYWKFHHPRPAPTPQVPIQAQTEIPPPSANPVGTPPPPTTPVEPTPPPVAPAPEVTKKPILRKPRPAVAPHPAPAPPPQPEPVVVAPQPKPTPSTPSPDDIAKAEAAKLANAPRIINVVGSFGLKEATFTFSAGGKTLYQDTVKGKKKKAGFLGMKGSYEGSFSHTLTVPPGVPQLTVHVESRDGSMDVSSAIKMPTAGGFIPTLSVQIESDQLLLSWKGGPATQ